VRLVVFPSAAVTCRLLACVRVLAKTKVESAVHRCSTLGGIGGCLAAFGGVGPGSLGRRALSGRSPITRRVFLIANGEFASGGQGNISESFCSSTSDYLSAALERLLALAVLACCALFS